MKTLIFSVLISVSLTAIPNASSAANLTAKSKSATAKVSGPASQQVVLTLGNTYSVYTFNTRTTYKDKAEITNENLAKIKEIERIKNFAMRTGRVKTAEQFYSCVSWNLKDEFRKPKYQRRSAEATSAFCGTSPAFDGGGFSYFYLSGQDEKGITGDEKVGISNSGFDDLAKFLNGEKIIEESQTHRPVLTEFETNYCTGANGFTSEQCKNIRKEALDANACKAIGPNLIPIQNGYFKEQLLKLQTANGSPAASIKNWLTFDATPMTCLRCPPGSSVDKNKCYDDLTGCDVMLEKWNPALSKCENLSCEDGTELSCKESDCKQFCSKVSNNLTEQLDPLQEDPSDVADTGVDFDSNGTSVSIPYSDRTRVLQQIQQASAQSTLASFKFTLANTLQKSTCTAKERQLCSDIAQGAEDWLKSVAKTNCTTEIFSSFEGSECSAAECTACAQDRNSHGRTPSPFPFSQVGRCSDTHMRNAFEMLSYQISMRGATLYHECKVLLDGGQNERAKSLCSGRLSPITQNQLESFLISTEEPCAGASKAQSLPTSAPLVTPKTELPGVK